MNRTLMFGIVGFLALVGFALLGNWESAAQAGHGCCGGCYGCQGCGGCYGGGGCCGGCWGCHGGWRRHGCHGCWGGCSGCCGGCHGGGGPPGPPPKDGAGPKKAETKPLGFREVSFRR